MSLRCLCFALAYWHGPDPVHYSVAYSGSERLNLRAWKERMEYLFRPIGMFWASGTWSDPAHNPVPEILVVNAGCQFDRPYEGERRHYGKAAFSAAIAYALNRNDWDLLVAMDTDSLFGDIDIDSLLREFLSRQEVMLCPG